MTRKIVRLPALAVGAAALALSAASPAWAWYSTHHARHWGYRTHHVVIHRPAYRYSRYAWGPAVAAGDIVGGAGALAGGIASGLLGATALVGPYNCAYGYPSAAYPGAYCPPYGYYTYAPVYTYGY